MNEDKNHQKKLKSSDSATMKDLPLQDRPYEKCMEKGPAFLSDAELLAVILRTGSCGETAVALSSRLLDQPGKKGLLGIYHMSTAQLMQIHGIGKVKAVQIRCIAELSRRISKTTAKQALIFNNPDTIAEYYMEDFRHREQEHLMVLMLDIRGKLLGEELISKGTAYATMASPREIFLCAMRYSAVSIILLHNHPSGNPAPSKEDLEMTEQVRISGEMIGVILQDHLIIGDQQYYSFRMEGLL